MLANGDGDGDGGDARLWPCSQKLTLRMKHGVMTGEEKVYQNGEKIQSRCQYSERSALAHAPTLNGVSGLLSYSSWLFPLALALASTGLCRALSHTCCVVEACSPVNPSCVAWRALIRLHAAVSVELFHSQREAQTGIEFRIVSPKRKTTNFAYLYSKSGKRDRQKLGRARQY